VVEPLFFRGFDQTPSAGDLIELSGQEAKHAISVRRMRVGEAIQLSNGLGLRARGSVAQIDGQQLKMLVDEVSVERQPALAITLVQALAKGDRDELAVQAATELGAVGIIPWQAERSISRWDGAKVAKGVERWQTIATEAAKQSLRALHPKVADLLTTKQLTAEVGSLGKVLVLDPTASIGLSEIKFELPTSIAVVVGPEGGISDSELEMLENAGAVRVHIGESILRTSTAGLAAISGIQALAGIWGNA
jgi:16S rRNA (uracil1498-N3)-methyltransferase